MNKMNYINHCSHYDSVYKEAEIKANSFNLSFLVAMSIVAIISSFLSILRVFSAPLERLLIAFLISLVFFMTPIVAFVIHNRILKKEHSILESDRFKYFICAFAYLGLLLIDVMLSFQAILLVVIPPLMAAQYKFNKRDWFIILFSTIITIPLVIYGSYIFGIADKNLLKSVAEEDLYDISKRVESLGNGRAFEVLLHHVLPKVICIVVVDLLLWAIVSRHSEMLNKQAELAHEVSEEAEKRNQLQTAVIDELATVIETRDVGTGEHVKRTKKYVRILATHLAEKDKYRHILTPEVINKMETAAALHDIGKIAVSDTILLKPGRLTPEEFDKMKIHTTKGGELVKKFFEHFEENNFYEDAYDIAMYHHEKWDGSGYPTGLKGEEIPLAARIMAIADVFDALTTKRVYKDAFTPEEAFDIIFKEAGTHFDPELVEVLKTIKDEFVAEAFKLEERRDNL